MKKVRIDYFSDTNTDPSQEMREAMAQAEVGNEVAGEDPTVNALLEKMCHLLGKEAAVFLPSGTMCNGIAYRVFCERPGDFVILEANAHPLTMSSGLISGLASAQPLPIQGRRGIFTPEQVESKVSMMRGYNLSFPRVVSVEQTTNFGGGAIWPLATIEGVCDVARRYGTYTHMDGARLFNASSKTGIPMKEYCKHFDSVWVDFCKTLGAPMGAVLAGSQEFIDRAWYYKFQQGGGMHQAGFLAAACLYALEHNYSKIPEVHRRAAELADRLSEISSLELNRDEVETNIVIFKVDKARDLSQQLLQQGIRVHPMDEERVRVIVHLDITDKDIDETYKMIRVLKG